VLYKVSNMFFSPEVLAFFQKKYTKRNPAPPLIMRQIKGRQ
jgi:hypothetical protein